MGARCAPLIVIVINVEEGESKRESARANESATNSN